MEPLRQMLRSLYIAKGEPCNVGFENSQTRLDVTGQAGQWPIA
jgi:hypothetical protein